MRSSDRKIVIEVNLDDYSVAVEAFGYRNRGCSIDLDLLERELGFKTEKRELKPEYFASERIDRAIDLMIGRKR